MEKDKFDRLETNFRLSLISQREQSAKLRELAGKVNGLTTVLAEVTGGLSEVAGGLAEVAEKSEQTADRLEDSIQVMHRFAENQAEIRKTLSEHGRRLDALEAKAG